MAELSPSRAAGGWVSGMARTAALGWAARTVGRLIEGPIGELNRGASLDQGRRAVQRKSHRARRLAVGSGFRLGDHQELVVAKEVVGTDESACGPNSCAANGSQLPRLFGRRHPTEALQQGQKDEKGVAAPFLRPDDLEAIVLEKAPEPLLAEVVEMHGNLVPAPRLSKDRTHTRVVIRDADAEDSPRGRALGAPPGGTVRGL